MAMSATDFVVAAQALSKTYQAGDTEVQVLKSVTLNVAKGEFVALCGPSGSGKTTLLNLISGIDRPSSGIIRVLGEDLAIQDEDFLAEFRCDNVGYVFQSYNLVSTLTAAENIAFPMEWARKPASEIEARVAKLLEIMGLQ
jgi:putative ABC transport system ATP-binding protein